MEKIFDTGKSAVNDNPVTVNDNPVTVRNHRRENVISNGNSENSVDDGFCFLKFYHKSGSDRDIWIKTFVSNINNAILHYGENQIYTLIETLREPNEKHRIIYAQRHMGMTSFFHTIQDEWKKGKIGECVYYSCKEGDLNKMIKEQLSSLCKSFTGQGDNYLRKIEGEKINNIKNYIINELVCNGIITNNRRRQENLNEKRTLCILDDFDDYICEFFNNSNYNPYVGWFFRKCWIKAILDINRKSDWVREKVQPISIILGCRTLLKEYKNLKEERDTENISGLGVEKSRVVFNLCKMYGTLLVDGLGDACFYQCPILESGNQYKCNKTERGFCRYFLSDDYWNDYWNYKKEESYPNPKYEKKVYIRNRVLGERYNDCNCNPYWLILPLTCSSIVSSETDCLSENADQDIKEKYIGIIDDFVAIKFLYCNNPDMKEKLYDAINSYKDIYMQAIANGKSNVILQRKHKRKGILNCFKKLKEKGNENEDQNILAKMLFEDSGMVGRSKEGQVTNDEFVINGFVRYIYNRREKHFIKE